MARLGVNRGKLRSLGDYMTVGKAARFLGVSSATLRNWDRAGKLRAVRHPVNGYRLYDRVQLESLLQRLAGRGTQKGG